MKLSRLDCSYCPLTHDVAQATHLFVGRYFHGERGVTVVAIDSDGPTVRLSDGSVYVWTQPGWGLVADDDAGTDDSRPRRRKAVPVRGGPSASAPGLTGTDADSGGGMDSGQGAPSGGGSVGDGASSGTGALPAGAPAPVEAD